MAQVVIYTKTYCPFSKEAKEILKQKKVEFDEKVVDSDEELFAEMKLKSSQRTDTPQIFINGHHIGSVDDLKALDRLGKLDEMLNI